MKQILPFGLIMMVIGLMTAQGPEKMTEIDRSWMPYHMKAMKSLPQEYKGLENPLEPTKKNINAGEKLFMQYCATCHGNKGMGDGPGGQALNPKPTPLAITGKMPMVSDGYLLWRIKEGGISIGTAMPPWKAALNEQQIWQIILFIRKGLPETEFKIDTLTIGEDKE